MTFMSKEKAIEVARKNNEAEEETIDAYQYLAEEVQGNAQGLWKVTVWDTAADYMGTL